MPRSHPHVTMRLETPVLYFYPHIGQQAPVEVDVHVDFRGGWLTEFYPHAEADAPGTTSGSGSGGGRAVNEQHREQDSPPWQHNEVADD